MSDDHRGLPHDLPDYVPNWPAPGLKAIKARVYRDGAWWRWEHACAYRGRALNYGYPEASQIVAFARAQKHMEDCW